MKNLFIPLFLLFSAPAFCAGQDSATFFYQKGLEEKALQKYLVAAGDFEKAISFNKSFTEAYVENGYVNLQMHRTDIAKNNFVKAVELDPGNAKAINELVELFYNYHQYQDAINYAVKCKDCDHERTIAMSYFKMEDYGNAEKRLLAFLSKNPKDAEATYTLGRAYLEMELETKAIPYYLKAIDLDGTKYQWMVELGTLYFNNNNFKGAAAYFNRAVENGYVKNNDFNENLGFAYLYSGEYDKGEKIIQELIARKPGDKDLVRDMAQAFYDAKLYDKCLDYCQKLMEADMKDGQALYQAGLCFQKKGQKDKGQAMCDKAIEMDPSLNKLRKQQSFSAGL